MAFMRRNLLRMESESRRISATQIACVTPVATTRCACLHVAYLVFLTPTHNFVARFFTSFTAFLSTFALFCLTTSYIYLLSLFLFRRESCRSEVTKPSSILNSYSHQRQVKSMEHATLMSKASRYGNTFLLQSVGKSIRPPPKLVTNLVNAMFGFFMIFGMNILSYVMCLNDLCLCSGMDCLRSWFVYCESSGLRMLLILSLS
mmetsp:Transcript_17341/g.23368  ORF Transcript_17341/g.23368 Transcript_17341/m.23368 type:complete len:203 (-) Transcript_17341:62-670(-)